MMRKYVWYLGKVGECESRRMGMQTLHVGCNSAGFEKGELVHVIRQFSISGSLVLHNLILLDGCRR
jgi:hypothetical protein